MKKATMFLFSFIILSVMSFTGEVFLGSNFPSSFNVRSKDAYSELKFGLSSLTSYL